MVVPGFQVDTESLARYRDANLLVLRALADARAFGDNWTTKRVTACLVEVREDIKYNLVSMLYNSIFFVAESRAQ
jgi:hypothetical protein